MDINLNKNSQNFIKPFIKEKLYEGLGFSNRKEFLTN